MTNHQPPQPASDADSRLELLLRENPDLRGAFHGGYTSEDIDEVLTLLNAATGLHIACLWNDYDWTFHRHSEWYITSPEGILYNLVGDLWTWITEAPGTEVPVTPGRPETWVGDLAPIDVNELAIYMPAAHNYAIHKV